MKRLAAFTLIELLVVISIIALLIAILLPALGAARKTAQRMQSLSNIRQISIAAVAYSTDDQQNRLPPRVHHSQMHWLGKAGTLRPLPPRYRPVNEYFLGTSNISDNAEVELAHAPLDTGADEEASTYDLYGSSYAPNIIGQPGTYSGGIVWGIGGNSSEAFTNDDGYQEIPSISTDVIPNTSRMVIVGEYGMYFNGWSYNSPREAPGFTQWSFGQGVNKWNAGFADGHGALIEVKPGETWGDDFQFSWKDSPASYVQP